MCFYLLTRANLLDNNGKPLGPHFVPRFRLSNLNPIGCLHIFADMCLGVDALVNFSREKFCLHTKTIRGIYVQYYKLLRF